MNLKIPSQHTCGETTKGTKICNDSFHWCQVEIPRLQSAIYRLDYWWYTQRAWLTPKSPYVKQRSFLNGTDVYCIDAALLDNNYFPSGSLTLSSSFLLASTATSSHMGQRQFSMGPDIRSNPRKTKGKAEIVLLVHTVLKLRKCNPGSPPRDPV